MLLQLRHKGGISSQLFGPFLILDEDESFVRSLDTVTGISVVLDGANHEVDVVVADIHPLHVTLEIFVCTEGFGTKAQIFGKLLIASEF